MNFNILVEGIDNVGKSTLVRSLAKWYYNKQPIITQSIGAPFKDDLGLRTSKKYYAKLFKLLADDDFTVIADRSHLGESVYAPIYRNYSGQYVMDFEEKLTDKKTFLILLDSTNLQEISNREDGLSLSQGNSACIGVEAERFRQAFEKSTLCKFYIDTDGMSADDVFVEVLRWVGENL